MKKKYLPLIALAAGFLSALITAGIHSILFCLLPVWAFALGYFSSWRWGLLNGFLLFLGYTFATALMWYGISPNLLYALQYFYAFIAGRLQHFVYRRSGATGEERHPSTGIYCRAGGSGGCGLMVCLRGYTHVQLLLSGYNSFLGRP